MRSITGIVVLLALVTILGGCGPKTQMGKEKGKRGDYARYKAEGPYYIGKLGQRVKHGKWVTRWWTEQDLSIPEHWLPEGRKSSQPRRITKIPGNIVEGYYKHGKLIKEITWSPTGEKQIREYN